MSLSSLDELIGLKDTIDSLTIATSRIQDLRDALLQAKKCRINGDLLKSSKIGIVVNKLKTHSDIEISELSGDIVNEWKRQMSSKMENPPVRGSSVQSMEPVVPGGGGGGDMASKKRTHEKMNIEENDKKSNVSTQRKYDFLQNNQGSPPPNQMQLPSFDNVTSDPTRNKCIGMFLTALLVGVEERRQLHQTAAANKMDQDGNGGMEDTFHEVYEVDNASSIAIAIEKSIYEGTVDSAYKGKVRSKYLNLKEKTNPQLRLNLLNGRMTARRFAEMTSAEMASDALKQEIQTMEKDNLLKVRSAQDNSAETDMFQCGRCKQRKCKYFQLQTRSADEPMTTYVTCVHCGNRWKMS